MRTGIIGKPHLTSA